MEKNNTIHNGCFGVGTAYRDGLMRRDDGFFTVWLCCQ